MSLARRLGLLLIAAAGLPLARAAAVCKADAACSVAQLPASCCVGNTCTIDGKVTVSGATCDFNFGVKNVIIKTNSGKFEAGTSTVTIEAGSFKVEAPGQL